MRILSVRFMVGALLATGSAAAQPVGDSETTEVAPVEAQPPPLRPFAPAHHWERLGPAALQGVVDVAMDPADARWVALITADGTVWVSDDGGVNVRLAVGSDRRLGVLSDDEDVIRDVEAFVEDVLDAVDVDDPTTWEDFENEADEAQALADAASDAAQSSSDAADTIRGDVDTGAALLDENEVSASPLRVWWGPAGQLLASREDGLYLSDDRGRTFRRVLEVPVWSLAYLQSRGLWVAGTSDGFRWAIDPRGWIDSEDGSEGLVVRDLSAVNDGVYAATERGVYFAPDAQQWERITEPRPFTAIEADPDWVGGFWVADAQMVYRSDNSGINLRPALGSPLTRVVDIHRVQAGQLLLATRSDGPWESTDGGTRFVPIYAGLPNPDSRAIAQVGRSVLLATSSGLMRLMPDGEVASREVSYVELGILLDAATGRRGLTSDRRSVGIAPRYLLPSVQVEARRQRASDLFWNGGTTRGDDADWFISTRLIFSPRPGRHQGGGGDTSVLVTSYGVELVSDAEGLTGSMDRRSRRGAVQYRATLVERIAAMHGARIELAGRPTTGLTLAERVQRTLRISELDAELDLLTEGAVTSWMLAASEEG